MFPPLRTSWSGSSAGRPGRASVGTIPGAADAETELSVRRGPGPRHRVAAGSHDPKLSARIQDNGVGDSVGRHLDRLTDHFGAHGLRHGCGRSIPAATSPTAARTRKLLFMIPVPSDRARPRSYPYAGLFPFRVAMHQIQTDASCNRRQCKQQRADSQAPARSLDRRDGNGLRRKALRDRRRRIDLRKHASGGRLGSGGSRPQRRTQRQPKRRRSSR